MRSWELPGGWGDPSPAPQLAGRHGAFLGSCLSWKSLGGRPPGCPYLLLDPGKPLAPSRVSICFWAEPRHQRLWQRAGEGGGSRAVCLASVPPTLWGPGGQPTFVRMELGFPGDRWPAPGPAPGPPGHGAQGEGWTLGRLLDPCPGPAFPDGGLGPVHSGTRTGGSSCPWRRWVPGLPAEVGAGPGSAKCTPHLGGGGRTSRMRSSDLSR